MDPGSSSLTAARRGSAGAAWAAGRPAALAMGAGLAAFLVGAAAESVIIRAVHSNRRELEWLSDAVMSIAVAGITYLWLHLKAARTRVLTLEREQIVIDEQLRLAAEIQHGLLPNVPQAPPGFRWAARMIPAGRIGGDFYEEHAGLPCATAIVVRFETAPGRLPTSTPVIPRATCCATEQSLRHSTPEGDPSVCFRG